MIFGRMKYVSKWHCWSSLLKLKQLGGQVWD